MKLWATLAVVVALLTAPVSNAAADVTNLWDLFPANQGDNGFTPGAWNGASFTLLESIGAYSYAYDSSGSNPTINRVGSTGPWIQMVPSDTLTAVLAGHPNNPESVHFYNGEFAIQSTGQVRVAIGKVINNLPEKAFWDAILDGSGNPGTNSSATFNFTELVSATTGLYFTVVSLDGSPSLDTTWLKSDIDSNPVPVPGALLLFGSGLLGLAGWRKFRN